MNKSTNGVSMKTHRSRSMLGVTGTEPRSEIMTVTPEMASQWLAKNTANNRPVNNRRVDLYARDMKAGRWQLTHQGVAFNRTGELIDGQHRLHAVVSAGVNVELTVSTGYAVEYDSPIDQGGNRTAAQILHRSSRWAAVVRGLYFLTMGEMGSWSRRVSITELLHTYEAHGEVLGQISSSIGEKLPGGVLAALCWMFPIAKEDVLSFGIQVRDGELLERGDPALALRNWLSSTRRPTTMEAAFATIGSTRLVLQKKTQMSVYAAPTAYRWSCQRRRAMKIVPTPTPQEVPSPGGGEE